MYHQISTNYKYLHTARMIRCDVVHIVAEQSSKDNSHQTLQGVDHIGTCSIH